MPVIFLLKQWWAWAADTGVNLAILFVIALLIPRAGRFIERVVTYEVSHSKDDNEQKASLAFAGVGIYIGQIIAYFVLGIAFLQEIGFSLAGAAIPATVVSAAIGFGAQSIIADFLAGFFVLSEKQYGVGDWVRFEGNGVQVEGTVTAITMRATTIRTLAQETITIPNSTARVCVNTSNYFSQAVIVMPIPLSGSPSAQAAVGRAEAAARRALAREDIAEHLHTELDVQPGTAVNPPATVGAPWTVDIRFLLQVDAGQQWRVERAVRMAVVEEFFTEYNEASPVPGSTSSRALFDASPAAENKPAVPSPATAGSSAAPATEILKEPAPAVASTTRQGPVPPGPEEAIDTAEQSDEAAAYQSNRWARYKASFTQMRGSTGWLLAAVMGLILAKMLTFTAEDAHGQRVAGILAPPAPPTEITTVAPEPAEEPSPTTTFQEEPTTTPTPTPEPTSGNAPAPVIPDRGSSQREPRDDNPVSETSTSHPAPRNTTPASPTSSPVPSREAPGGLN
ncbi:mechanosensitive ion channel family protein [Corynebacterium tapiri]|nr:mechanosensitive ion channel family protein [Corynebacterium tapiri]